MPARRRLIAPACRGAMEIFTTNLVVYCMGINDQGEHIRTRLSTYGDRAFSVAGPRTCLEQSSNSRHFCVVS